MRPWKVFKGYTDNCQILKGMRDTFVKIQSTFRDMAIQSLLKWGEIWGYFPISFEGYGILFEIFKGDPLPGHQLCLHEIEKSLLSRIFLF